MSYPPGHPGTNITQSRIKNINGLSNWKHRRQSCTLFAWLISHQSVVLFSQNKSVTSNQPAILFSQNKSVLAISHQPNEQTVEKE
jgi:hypothetical protein